jgi:phage terminase large subunit-like protein
MGETGSHSTTRGVPIVSSANNGGDLTEATIRSVDQNVSYRKVHVSKGKVTRAEPVSALYEQNRGSTMAATHFVLQTWERYLLRRL